MERFRSVLLASVLVLAGCELTPPVPTPPAVAPKPQEYSCAFTRRLLVEYDALSAGSGLRAFTNDSIELRDRNRAVRGESKPAPCPAEGER